MGLHDEISKLAYELYEKSGRPEGRDLENWCEAERIVIARHAEKEKTGKGTDAAVGQKDKKTGEEGMKKDKGRKPR